MKNSLLLMALFVSLLLPNTLAAQIYSEKDMTRIMSYIIDLRDISADEQVLARMRVDEKWTLMNELEEDYEGQCPLREKMGRFGINDLAMRIEEERNGFFKSAGVFCDGTDPRFNYSFVEKSVKPGKIVTYSIPGRSGRQLFIIIPFVENSALEIIFHHNDESIIAKREDSGNYRAEMEVSKGHPLSFSITNCSTDTPVSFVILNYNEHKEK